MVRGGVLDPARLRRRALQDRRDDGIYVLSVWCGARSAEEDVEDVLRRLVTEAPIPHGRLNVTTAGAVIRAGFELQHAPPPDSHYDVVLGTVLDDVVVGEFILMFDSVRSNLWGRG